MQRIRKEDGAIKSAEDRWIFSEGDPRPGGHPPTRLTAKFMNALMEELCHAVEGAGYKLDEKDDEQLLRGIRSISKYSYFDYVIGDGFGAFSSLADALTHIEEGKAATILITKDETVTGSIIINKSNLLIAFAPGVTYSGSVKLGEGLDDPSSKAIFKIDAPSITVRGGRFGFSSILENQNAFYTTERGKYLLLDGPRLFGFGTRTGFTGRSPIQTSVFIKE